MGATDPETGSVGEVGVGEVGVGEIVVGVDGGEDAFEVVRYGLEQARLAEAEVRLVRVVPQIGPLPPLSMLVGDIVMDGGRAQLDLMAEHAAEMAPDVEVHTQLAFGPRNAELVAAAEKAELLVLGLRRHGPVHQHSTGSTAAAVASLAQCPVRVVPSGWRRRGRRDTVVVGVATVETAVPLIRRGWEIARRTGMSLTVVHVRIDAGPGLGRTELAALVVEARREARAAGLHPPAAFRPRVDVQVRSGSALAPVLAGYPHAALLIVGRTGRSRPFEHVGHTTRALLRLVDGPLEILPLRPRATDGGREEWAG